MRSIPTFLTRANLGLLGASAVLLTAFAAPASAQAAGDAVFEPGHPSLAGWLLPDRPPFPADNEPTTQRVELGKRLFFDPRLSGDGNMSCASCHNPLFGWSDGLPTARGAKSQTLARATPTIVNSAYNGLQMWDGRKQSLEDQAMGPLEASVEMNMDLDQMLQWLRSNDEYRSAFAEAYPGRQLDSETVSMAIASFERTVVSNDSPFDRWVRGDAAAMSEQEVRGFRVFADESKGNCASCHSAPNFTDDGFHNIGLRSWGDPEPDMGRYAQKPIQLMKGAFKTPTLRDVALTAPYFHDGSAATLMEVVEHYATGGVERSNLAPGIKALDLSREEKEDLVAFMHALTTSPTRFVLPELPVVEPGLAAAGSERDDKLAELAR